MNKIITLNFSTKCFVQEDLKLIKDLCIYEISKEGDILIGEVYLKDEGYLEIDENSSLGRLISLELQNINFDSCIDLKILKDFSTQLINSIIFLLKSDKIELDNPMINNTIENNNKYNTNVQNRLFQLLNYICSRFIKIDNKLYYMHNNIVRSIEGNKQIYDLIGTHNNLPIYVKDLNDNDIVIGSTIGVEKCFSELEYNLEKYNIIIKLDRFCFQNMFYPIMNLNIKFKNELDMTFENTKLYVYDDNKVDNLFGYLEPNPKYEIENAISRKIYINSFINRIELNEMASKNIWVIRKDGCHNILHIDGDILNNYVILTYDNTYFHHMYENKKELRFLYDLYEIMKHPISAFDSYDTCEYKEYLDVLRHLTYIDNEFYYIEHPVNIQINVSKELLDDIINRTNKKVAVYDKDNNKIGHISQYGRNGNNYYIDMVYYSNGNEKIPNSVLYEFKYDNKIYLLRKEYPKNPNPTVYTTDVNRMVFDDFNIPNNKPIPIFDKNNNIICSVILNITDESFELSMGRILSKNNDKKKLIKNAYIIADKSFGNLSQFIIVQIVNELITLFIFKGTKFGDIKKESIDSLELLTCDELTQSIFYYKPRKYNLYEYIPYLNKNDDTEEEKNEILLLPESSLKNEYDICLNSKSRIYTKYIIDILKHHDIPIFLPNGIEVIHLSYSTDNIIHAKYNNIENICVPMSELLEKYIIVELYTVYNFTPEIISYYNNCIKLINETLYFINEPIIQMTMNLDDERNKDILNMFQSDSQSCDKSFPVYYNSNLIGYCYYMELELYVNDNHNILKIMVRDSYKNIEILKDRNMKYNKKEEYFYF